MKRARTILLVLALGAALSIGLALNSGRCSQAAIASPASPAVVVLQGGETPLSIRDSQSSTGAPTFALGDSLAQALADLLAQGFEIKHVDGLTYTLVKR
jgi:hypothetical protein